MNIHFTFAHISFSTLGEFAMSYVKADKRVVHMKILNSPGVRYIMILTRT